MILLKKWAKDKIKSYNYCENQFLREKRHKEETKNVNKNSLFCSLFVMLFIALPLELRKLLESLEQVRKI